MAARHHRLAGHHPHGAGPLDDGDCRDDPGRRRRAGHAQRHRRHAPRSGFMCSRRPTAPCAGLNDRRPVDLVVTDLLMPGVGGLELADELRTRAPETPVVVRLVDRRPRRPLTSGGRARVLRKPLRRAELWPRSTAALADHGSKRCPLLHRHDASRVGGIDLQFARSVDVLVTVASPASPGRTATRSPTAAPREHLAG